MAFKKRQAHGAGGGGGGHGDGDDLMITPLLDLFVALIPFLIVSAILTKINVVDVGIAKPVGAASAPSSGKQFDLLLKISESKVEILMGGKVQRTIASSDAWIDDVRKELVEIKKKNPDELKLRIEPVGNANLELIMAFMDAARKLRPADGEIMKKDESGKSVKLQYLFPNVILRGVYKS